MGKIAKRSIIAIVVAVVLFCVVSFALDRFSIAGVFERHGNSPVSELLLPSYDEYEANYPRTDDEFQIDGQTLRGHIYGANNNDQGLVVFRHGLFSEHEDYLPFITSLVDRGWKVYAYDAIGCGASDGDSALGMVQSAIDVDAALDHVAETNMANGLPVLLMGHSWGGFGVTAALQSHPDDVAGVVSLSGFNDATDIMYESSISSYGPIAMTQKPFIWLNTYIDFGDSMKLTGVDGINSTDVPVLVAHGMHDETIRYDGASIMNNGVLITNPNVEYLTFSNEGRDGHNTYFYSAESYDYLLDARAELEEIEDRYDGNAPAEELQAAASHIDKLRANTADPALMDHISAFFSDCCN